jgi:hypothetical protein
LARDCIEWWQKVCIFTHVYFSVCWLVILLCLREQLKLYNVEKLIGTFTHTFFHKRFEQATPSPVKLERKEPPPPRTCWKNSYK